MWVKVGSWAGVAGSFPLQSVTFQFPRALAHKLFALCLWRDFPLRCIFITRVPERDGDTLDKDKEG